ncbi:2-methoxy-6-polyprenyl-14-benzoquinol methylase mitochondrial [Zea mays]|uniref:2-methoxy-6-polyprenyl-14-benzoquinol methylase mitochondrial n=1 Tax=Zea mays TaxID=4577 RepID=A0A1D6KGH6_MAIZE|nr:2-methoxy-6-polyprenyl-14-benzoquinol methylase mitochondrial [Zea mays]
MKSLSKSTCVREVLSTCADQSYLGILLNCCLCCSLASILHTPSNESCAKFFEALVLALEELHQFFVFITTPPWRARGGVESATTADMTLPSSCSLLRL